MADTAFVQEVNNTVRVNTALAYIRAKDYYPEMTALLTILGANEDAMNYEKARREEHERYIREMEAMDESRTEED